MRDAFASALNLACEKHHNIFFVVADISPASSLDSFLSNYPSRFIDVGVSEQSLIGISAGLAIKGYRPFAYTIANFAIYRPFEQVRIDLCYQNLPVVIVGVGGGVSYSALGGTHHTIEDVAVMCALPNMTVVAPCDPLEVNLAVQQSFLNDGPMYLRLGKSGEKVITDKANEEFQIGKIREIQAGERVAIIGYGPIMEIAFEAAKSDKLLGEKIGIYSSHTLKPFDDERMLKLLSMYEKIVVLEEHVFSGGLASQVTRVAHASKINCELSFFHLKDEFIHFYGTRIDILAEHGITQEKIIASLMSVEKLNG